jgi:hypothetical protein
VFIVRRRQTKNGVKMAKYQLTEIRMYECSCDTTVRYTDAEMKLHAQSHKDSGSKVIVQPIAGYSFEL